MALMAQPLQAPHQFFGYGWLIGFEMERRIT